MALNKDGLKEAIITAMQDNPTSKDAGIEAMAGAIVDYLSDNLEVSIPASSVVTSVTGQAVGNPNATSIACEVK